MIQNKTNKPKQTITICSAVKLFDICAHPMNIKEIRSQDFTAQSAALLANA
jgi:hypothetical protein